MKISRHHAPALAVLLLALTSPSYAQGLRNCNDVTIDAVKEGDKEIKGRLRPAIASTSSFEITSPRTMLRNQFIDRTYGDFKLDLASGLVKGDLTIELSDAGVPLCKIDLKVKELKDEAWIDWMPQLPLRETTSTIAFKTGKDTKSVLALVVVPRLGSTEESESAIPPRATKALVPSPAGTVMSQLRLRVQEAGKIGARSSTTRSSEASIFDRLNQESDCAFGSLVQAVEAPAKDGKAEIVFKEPLDKGQCVYAFPVGDTPQSVDLDGKQIAVVASLDRSYGRFNLYGNAGFTVGSSGTAASQTSPYFSVIMDGVAFRNYVSRRKREISRWGASLNFFIEGRLSQAPTTNVTGANLVAAANGITMDQVQSQLFQTAFYVPVRTPGMSWVNDGAFHSFYIAPIAKYGLQWVKDGIETKVTSVRPSPVVLPGTTITVPETKTPVTSTNAQPFYGAGFRVGFSRYTFANNRVTNDNMRRESLGSLDMIYGHQHAFRTPFEASRVSAVNPTTNLNEVTVIRGTRIEPRLMIEGRVRVPLLPVVVGVEASRNWSKPDAAVSELRFFVAVRVDLMSALSKGLNLKAK